ncbi:amidase [Carboxylicivirga linearis]|uniref:Amidase n=1 Tax=Carboxylicivirga linearis TaxID=1628157 RepID=A0ABS5JQF1_9BACT|nr:amidase [Carboxylicivirga linearis]MBS2097029.1 amidase [Carboxylicivirga linearis]
MKRRHFILNSLLAGVALGVNACKPGGKKVSEPIDGDLQSSFELDEISVQELQVKMQKGEFTSKQITNLYINRIKTIDHLKTNAVVEINPDAVAIAEVLDKERQEGKVRGPLHGIPVLIKDNINTGDKMITSAGSLAFIDHSASKDAFIIEKLREAGMVLLGKTNLSEWANFRSTNSSSGWSGRGGQTRNPYVLDRTPCGSSSGSAVAVSANFAPIAIGTETDGSIVCPSGINGIVGIKPTVGTWSRSGIIPISESQDTAGPMGKSVKDAALLLRALVAKDNDDAATQKQPDNFGIYLNFDEYALQGSRIGYLKSLAGFDKRVSAIMDEVVSTLKDKGADVVEVDMGDELNSLGQYEWTVLLCEFKDGVNKYLAAHPELPYKSLSDLIAFNKKNSKAEMPWFEQEIMEMSDQTNGLDDEKYMDAIKKCRELSQNKGIDKLIDSNKLDALMAPTNGAAWVIDFVNGDNFGGGSSQLAAISGYPSVTVPAGDIKGLPIGVSFFGKAWTESRLIQLSHAYEVASKKRIVPEFKTSLLDV